MASIDSNRILSLFTVPGQVKVLTLTVEDYPA
jgi:hypothetical protein